MLESIPLEERVDLAGHVFMQGLVIEDPQEIIPWYSAHP
jgi:hypothetical protein